MSEYFKTLAIAPTNNYRRNKNNTNNSDVVESVDYTFIFLFRVFRIKQLLLRNVQIGIEQIAA